MRRLICTTMAVVGVWAAVPGSAVAQSVSPGCQALNDPGLDGTYPQGEVADIQFFAAETITVTAMAVMLATPVRFQVEQGGIVLRDEAQFVSSTVPTTFSYTVPADVTLTVRWRVELPNAVTWSVSCTAAAYPLAVSDPNLAADFAPPALVAASSPPPGSHPPVLALLAVSGLVVQAWVCVAVRRGRPATG